MLTCCIHISFCFCIVSDKVIKLDFISFCLSKFKLNFSFSGTFQLSCLASNCLFSRGQIIEKCAGKKMEWQRNTLLSITNAIFFKNWMTSELRKKMFETKIKSVIKLEHSSNPKLWSAVKAKLFHVLVFRA